MIQMPKRAVTRFFIPLIDVLILLFCIFLLMPLVEPSEDQNEESGQLTPGQALELMQEVETLRKENEKLRQTREMPQNLQEELERLRREKMLTLKDKLILRVLEIDPKTGRLYYHDPERTEIKTQVDALNLIARDRQARPGKDDVCYILLYPRDRSSGVPSSTQELNYERWFQSVPTKIDTPGSPGETKP